MIFNQDFAEQYKIFNCIPPVDLSAAANDGKPMPVSRFGGNEYSIRNFSRVTALVYKGRGTAGDDIEITVKQAKTHDADISSADPLICSSIHSASGNAQYFTQEAWVLEAENVSLLSADGLAELDRIWAIDIPISNIAEGNAVIAVSISQAGSAGNAQLGGCVMLGHNIDSNNGFVENHEVVFEKYDLKLGAFFKSMEYWPYNALRKFTWLMSTGVGTAGDDTTVSFHSNASGNRADTPFKRIYVANNTSGIDYELDRVDNADGSNSYTNDIAAENSTIWVSDFDIYDFPAEHRFLGGVESFRVEMTQTTNSQPVVAFAISSGARHTQR